MTQRSPSFRDDFQLKENNFTLPEHSIELDRQTKRALTICNLFVNHKMSISNINRVLDEDCGSIVLTLIKQGILYDRRQLAGRPPVGFERRIPAGKPKI